MYFFNDRDVKLLYCYIFAAHYNTNYVYMDTNNRNKTLIRMLHVNMPFAGISI